MSTSPELEKANESGSEFTTTDATPQDKRESDVEQGQTAVEQSSPREVHGIKWVLVVSAILSCTTLFALDNTVVADIQSPVIRQFGSVDKLPWLSVGYLLGSCTTNLFWGQCYTQFNAKSLFILCVAIFEVGSAVCGAAPTMDALVVGRVLCGLGGAGMYTGALTLLSINTTEQERSSYFGLTGISWGLGTCLGPIVGGGFAESSATWRWALYINLCVGAVCAPVYLFMIPGHDPQKGKSVMERVKQLDWVGGLLMCGVYLSGLMAVSFGGVLYAWNGGQIIALFVVFGVLSIAFSLQQIFCIGVTAERRIFPLEFVKSPFLMNMFWQTATAATTVFIPIYFIPLYFSFVRGDSSLDAGVRLLPYVVPMVVLCIANAFFLNKATAALRPLLPGESTESIQAIISGEGLDQFSETLQEQVVEVIVNNMRETFYVPMVAGALTLVLSFFLKWEKIF